MSQLSAGSKQPLCPKCGAGDPARLRRQGPLQRFIMPQVGIFPWECGNCRHVFLARDRGTIRKRAVSAAQMARPSSQG